MEKKIADLTVNEFQLLINQTVHKAFEEISEDILAISSPEYLKSIGEAGKDFKKGKTKTFEEKSHWARAAERLKSEGFLKGHGEEAKKLIRDFRENFDI